MKKFLLFLSLILVTLTGCQRNNPGDSSQTDTSDNQDAKLEDYSYEVIEKDGNKGIRIVSYKGDDENVHIPSFIEVDGESLPVIEIGESAFEDNEDLIVVEIPESVWSIGGGSFVGCSNLQSATIGENSQLTSIGDNAFYDCSSLTSIFIPDSVTSIGIFAFNSYSSTIYCEASSQPEGWDSNWYIHGYGIIVVWSSYKGINGITEDGLKYLALIDEEGNPYISITRYEGNSTVVDIPKVITYDGGDLTIKAIGDEAFLDCSSLTSIFISDSVVTIGSYVFEGCSSLNIYSEASSKPSGWNSYWNYSYSNSYSSRYPVVWVGGDIIIDGDYAYTIRNSDEETYIELVRYLGSEDLITIPDSINVSGKEIPVKAIGDGAFRGCSSLTSINISDSITSIGDYAFRSCSCLTTINIPDSVTTIGDYAFSYCSSLTSIFIPDSVVSIGDSAFDVSFSDAAYFDYYSTIICCEASSEPSGWNSRWNVRNRIVVWVGGDIIIDGDYAYTIRNSGEETYIELVRYLGSEDLITIPDSINVSGKEIPVKAIGDGAFLRCSSLTSITIPNSVTSIGDHAFYDCSSLTSIFIPDSVTSIGISAFVSYSLTIYCEASSKPSGWHSWWYDHGLSVYWGYTYDQYLEEINQ